jgi:alpha-D-xyloside xylohydrolase
MQPRSGSLALVGCLWACGGGETPKTRTLDSGAGVVVVSDAPSLRLTLGDATLLSFEADAFELGLAAVDDATIYDPYRYYVPHPLYEPPAVTWETPTAARFADDSPGLALLLDYPSGEHARVEVRISARGSFNVTMTPTGGRTAIFRLRPRAGASEGFYGLGEYFDSVDHRGKIRAMQIEADGSLESSYNEAHVPVPLLIGSRGWGLFVESQHPAAFAVAVGEPDRVEAAFGTGPASADGLLFHLFAADHPLDVTRHYYEVTGYPRLPARWALGPWVWRDETSGQAEVESDLDFIRDLDLATSGYWIDRPYATGVNTFDFAAEAYPDPEAMFAKLRALGFKSALWHTPYLDEEDPATQSLRDEAVAGGYYPPENALVLNGWGKPIDLTNPEAVQWWRDNLAHYIELGVEGFKLDYGEDVLAGPFANRTPWRFADGSDERTMHAEFPRLYHATYAELLPESGGFLLCRAGSYGDQVNGPIIWPGDLDANFAKHGERVETPDDSYNAVGGLPASIVAGLSLGPSGFPFYGSDTGGYRHSPTDNETFSRWFEQTALSTVMQIGTSANDVAWELGGENGFDQAMLERYREYTRLHLRLFPYLWSYAERLAEDGRPIARALGLAYPSLGVHPSDIYLLGDHLLVAPVISRGATSRLVTFPPGRWVHWFTGEAVEGPAEVEIDAPIGRLPLFLHGDGLVPMLRPTIDTLVATSARDRVDSYASEPGLLYVRAVARGSGSFELFDGGRVSQSSAGVAAESGSELDRGALFELVDAEPATVDAPELESVAELEGSTTAGYFYDAARRALWVRLPAGSAQVDIGW